MLIRLAGKPGGRLEGSWKKGKALVRTSLDLGQEVTIRDI
jgi:hypothetical protein